MPVVPDGARASTLNINSIHGGQAEDHDGLPSPCVPDSCRMVIDRRFLIEEGLEDVKGEVHGIARAAGARAAGLPLRRARPDGGAPGADRADHAGAARGGRARSARVLGREAQFICSPGTYDQKHIARIGHLHDCVAYGPGILDLAHQPDEFVGDRRPGGLGQGDGAGDAASCWVSAGDPPRARATA